MHTDSAPIFVNEVTRNGWVWAALAFCSALIALALWQPDLSTLLDLPHPGNGGLALAALLSLCPLAIGQFLLLGGVNARLRKRLERGVSGRRNGRGVRD